MTNFFQRFTNIAGVSFLALGLAFLAIPLSLGSLTIGGLTLFLLWRGAVWGGLFLVCFFAFTYYFSQFVLPIGGERGLSEGWRLLQQYFRNGNAPAFRVDNGALPDSFRVLGAGMIESHQAIVVGRGRAFGYAAGPGYVRISPNGDEHIMAQTFDLRPQQQQADSSEEIPVSNFENLDLVEVSEEIHGIQLITRDGIPLEVAVVVKFQVKLRQTQIEDPEGEVPYAYDEDALFRLCYADSVDPSHTWHAFDLDEGQLIIPWFRRIAPQVMADLFAEISLHDLEALYHTNGVAALDKIRRDVQNNFREAFKEVFGYHNADDCPIGYLSVHLRQLDTPAMINEQRIRDWQTKWESKIREMEAEGEVDILEQTRDTKQLEQMDLIRSLIDTVEQMRRQSDQNGNRVASVARLQILETLEELLEMDVEEAPIPEPLLTTLASMLTWLQAPPPTLGTSDTGGFNL